MRRGRQCLHCKKKPWEHAAQTMRCPDDSGRAYQTSRPRLAPSQSFPSDEVRVLRYILHGLLRGKDVRAAVRQPCYSGLVAKVERMHTRCEELERERTTHT